MTKTESKCPHSARQVDGMLLCKKDLGMQTHPRPASSYTALPTEHGQADGMITSSEEFLIISNIYSLIRMYLGIMVITLS